MSYTGNHESFPELNSPKFFMAIIGFYNRSLRGEASGLEQLEKVATQPGLTTLDAHP